MTYAPRVFAPDFSDEPLHGEAHCPAHLRQTAGGGQRFPVPADIRPAVRTDGQLVGRIAPVEAQPTEKAVRARLQKLEASRPVTDWDEDVVAAPRLPRKPSGRHSDLRGYIPALRTMRGLASDLEAAALPFEPVGLPANDNTTEGRISTGRIRPDDRELDDALTMPCEDNLRDLPEPEHRQARGFRFAKHGYTAGEFLPGLGYREFRVAKGEMVAFQLASGRWMRPAEEAGQAQTGQHAPPASPSTSRLAILFGGKYSGAVTPQRRHAAPAPQLDPKSRASRALQLQGLGVDGTVDLATARANCGLPVAANDNHRAALGFGADATELFMSCQVGFKGNGGWRTSRGALEMMVLAEELRDLVASVPADLLMRTDLILRASCLAEIGEAFGKAGRTSESAGKRITLEACREIKSILSRQGLSAIAA